MHEQIAGQEVDGRLLAHREGCRNDMQEGHRDHYARREAGEIAGVSAPPRLEAPDDKDAGGRHESGKQAGRKGCPETGFDIH